MEIPSKIFISKRSAESIVENGHSVSYVADKPEGYKNGAIEYTNLSDVWHDVIVEKQPQKVCGNNPVLVVGLRKGRISYRYLWTDMEDCWKDLDLLTPPTKKVYDKVLWSYLKDIVPFLNNEEL